MYKIEFSLSMPGVGAWNGRWSGERQRYLIYKNLTDKIAKISGLDRESKKSWSYRWDDGWCACVSARVMSKGERKQKSDGFCGYDWMVDSIIWNNEIKPTR